MITGHNTDITYNGVMYHVQTEDKGHSNPIVETLVYKGGEILDARRTSYEEMLTDGYDEGKIVSLIEEQHRSVIVDIKGGKYDRTMVSLDPLGEQFIDSTKTLDQVILEYLASQEKKERMVLELSGSDRFIEGKQAVLSVRTRNSSTGEALKGVRVVAKIISTVKRPLTVHEGKTDRNGAITVKFVVPEFQDGYAALLVQVFSESGSDEVKLNIEKSAVN